MSFRWWRIAPQHPEPGAITASTPSASSTRAVAASMRGIIAGCTHPASISTRRSCPPRGQGPGSGCCGAIRHHLNDTAAALDDVRRNIDAWWRYVDPASRRPVEAILMNASGCGAMVKDYAYLLRDDPAYAARAQRVVELTFDLAQWLPREFSAAREAGRVALKTPPAGRVAFHSPCTLQHAQQVRGEVESLLAGLGVELAPVGEPHMCCGSAGTYAVLQPELSQQLRERKLGNLEAGRPQMLLSANIGCIGHLQSGTRTPVRHWIEWLDDAIA